MRVLVLLALAGSLAFGGCASSGAIPRPYPGTPAAPAPARPPHDIAGLPAADPPAPSPVAASIADTARGLLGVPYRNGGADPAGFDCSGFVQYVCLRAGVKLPRSVRGQWEAGWPLDRAEVAPGDLLFFAIEGRDVSHVGIALGDDVFVHAPSERGVVRMERLSATYWARRFAGARRVSAASTSDGARHSPGDDPRPD